MAWRVSARGSSLILVLTLAWQVPAASAAENDPVAPRGAAEEILNATGIRGGLVVHVGCAAGDSAAGVVLKVTS